jgi:hypothetical protein
MTWEVNVLYWFGWGVAFVLFLVVLAILAMVALDLWSKFFYTKTELNKAISLYITWRKKEEEGKQKGEKE